MDAIGFIMSKNEVGRINESLKTKAIPKLKLFINDQKKLTSKGDFPSRLVILETNLSATFSKVRYLGLQKYWRRMRYIIQNPQFFKHHR